jgi:hypothetical protein
MKTKSKKKLTAQPLMYYPLTKPMADWLKTSAAAHGVQQRDIVKTCGMGQGTVSSIFTHQAKKVSAKNWSDMHTLLAGKGAKALDPKHDPALTLPNPEVLRAALLAFKETTKAGWSSISETCGVEKTTLMALTNGRSVSVPTLLRLQAGLRKLNALPNELAKAGLVLPPAPAKPAPAVAKRPSLIIKVSTSPFSEMELDVRELDILGRERELLARMRQHISVPGKHVNGARK